jgi:hypothetical protein
VFFAPQANRAASMTRPHETRNSASWDAAGRKTTGWKTTVAFWTLLLVAAGLYAVVVLSPKVLTYFELRKIHHDRQWELVGLEDRVQALGRTVAAFERDPRMASELTRSEFGVVDPREQRIPVDDELSFQLKEPRTSRVDTAGVHEPAWLPVVATVAGSRPIQDFGLLLAAAMVLFGFTFCGDRRNEMAEETG